MSEEYIKNNFSMIKQKASIIEKRLDDSYCTKELLIEEIIGELVDIHISLCLILLFQITIILLAV